MVEQVARETGDAPVRAGTISVPPAMALTPAALTNGTNGTAAPETTKAHVGEMSPGTHHLGRGPGNAG